MNRLTPRQISSTVASSSLFFYFLLTSAMPNARKQTGDAHATSHSRSNVCKAHVARQPHPTLGPRSCSAAPEALATGLLFETPSSCGASAPPRRKLWTLLMPGIRARPEAKHPFKSKAPWVRSNVAWSQPSGPPVGARGGAGGSIIPLDALKHASQRNTRFFTTSVRLQRALECHCKLPRFGCDFYTDQGGVPRTVFLSEKKDTRKPETPHKNEESQRVCARRQHLRTMTCYKPKHVLSKCHSRRELRAVNSRHTSRQQAPRMNATTGVAATFRGNVCHGGMR